LSVSAAAKALALNRRRSSDLVSRHDRSRADRLCSAAAFLISPRLSVPSWSLSIAANEA
jgi:hypothetical protein